MNIRFSAIFACLLPLAAANGAEASPSFVVDQIGRFQTVGAAVAAIGQREATISIAPGTYHQCAVQEAGAITYRATVPGRVIFDGVACEGKAALVLRGGNATVEGVVFQNLRVPDGNGAGIRLERGNLTVVNSVFRNSEEGILTHDDPAGTIRVERSTFSRLGRCDRDLDCAHGIYVGHYGRLTVTRTRFEAGTGGHYLKSRAARNDISDNYFDDSQGHLTNYMIDLSNGSAGIIERNIMVQGRDKDNHSAFITIAPEGRERDSSALVIRTNRAGFVPGLTRNSTFVANWTGDRILITGNDLAPGLKITDRR